MDLSAPFVGTLLIPEKILPGESPVTLPSSREGGGEVVAQIRRPMFAIRHSFAILDADGNVVAHGGSAGFLRRRWPVRAVDGSILLELAVAWSGTSGRSRVTLDTDVELTLKGSWWASRNYTVSDGENEIAQISPTTSAVSPWNDSYAFTLAKPVLSIIQAIGLAQSVRAEVKAARQAQSNTAMHHH